MKDYDSIYLIKNKKYMRIQGEKFGYKTKKPVTHTIIDIFIIASILIFSINHEWYSQLA
jgi:hypothetical protein